MRFLPFFFRLVLGLGAAVTPTTTGQAQQECGAPLSAVYIGETQGAVDTRVACVCVCVWGGAWPAHAQKLVRSTDATARANRPPQDALRPDKRTHLISRPLLQKSARPKELGEGDPQSSRVRLHGVLCCAARRNLTSERHGNTSCFVFRGRGYMWAQRCLLVRLDIMHDNLKSLGVSVVTCSPQPPPIHACKES